MKSDRPAPATQNKLPNSIRCWPLADKFISTKKHKLLSSWSPRFHFLKHCTWENAFDTSVFRYITHCMSACKSFAAQFSSMLHVTTDSVRVFIFWSIAHERTLLTQVFLGISHTACLRAKALRRNSHQCYMSPRTHWQDESYACWASQEVKPFPP